MGLNMDNKFSNTYSPSAVVKVPRLAHAVPAVVVDDSGGGAPRSFPVDVLHPGQSLHQLLVLADHLAVVPLALVQLLLVDLQGFEAFGELDGAELELLLEGPVLGLQALYLPEEVA